MFTVIASCNSEARVLINVVSSRELACEVAKDAAALGFYRGIRICEVPTVPFTGDTRQANQAAKYLTDNNLW